MNQHRGQINDNSGKDVFLSLAVLSSDDDVVIGS